MSFIKLKHFADANAVTIDSSKRYIGIIFTLFGWFLLGMNSVLNVEISKQSNILVSFFFQFSGGLLIFVLIGFVNSITNGLHKTASYLKPKELMLVLLRGSLGVIIFYLFSASKIWTSVVENAVLFSTEALFIPLILWIVLGRKIGMSIWIGLILGYIGVSLTYFSDVSVFNIGGIVGLCAGFGMAFIILLTSYMVKKDPPARIAVYQMGIGVVVSGLLAMLYWNTPPAQAIILMLFSGCIYGIALFLFLDAFYYTESFIIGMLSYSLILFTETIDWILHGVDNKHIILTGLICIIAGGLIVIGSSYRKDKINVLKK